MKKLSFVLVCVLIGLGSFAAHAQDIYLKVYPYKQINRLSDFPTSGASLTDGLGQANEAFDNGRRIQLNNYIQLSSMQYDLEQTLNIGQQTGTGAGKITFNPIAITKIVDALSPVLMKNSATGTPMTLEFIFVANGADRNTVRHKVLVGLAAVKTIGVSSAGDCTGG